MTQNGVSLIRNNRLSGSAFFLLGCALLIAKFGVDRIVASVGFGREWTPINYLLPIDSYNLFSLQAREQRFVLTMLAVAVPFALIGLVATSRRLRDAGLSQSLLPLFFIPIVNLLFFAAISAVPGVASNRRTTEGSYRPTAAEVLDELERESDEDIAASRAASAPDVPPRSVGTLGYASHARTRPPSRFWSAWLPEDASTSGFRAALVPVPICVGTVLLVATVFRAYGWGIFVALPFCCGFITSVLHGYSKPRSFGQCLSASTLSLLMSAVACILFAIEGIGCLIMASPIMFFFMFIGTCLGHAIQTRPSRPRGVPNALWAVLIVLPLMLGLDSRFKSPPEVFAVTTSIEVNAPPAVVWRHVVSFPDLAPPTDWVFRSGIAYPVRARIDGTGVGALRRCEFSTGTFVEPIRIWDEPRLLAFDVTSNPPAMQEWSPYNIRPPHVENFLLSHGGQFKLTALPNGRTLLEGTTWYEHRLYPETYWRWWSDAIIHRIHLRVLQHVAGLSEADEAAPIATIIAHP